MKTLFVLALLAMAGLGGMAWMGVGPLAPRDPALVAFESFYEDLLAHEYDAASAYVERGSRAHHEVIRRRQSARVAGQAGTPSNIRKVHYDVRAADRSETRAGYDLRIAVSLNPPDGTTAFARTVVHAVETTLTAEGGSWRVIEFRDRVEGN